MRLPLATVLTACALSAALLVAGRAGEEAKYTMPGPKAVLPAAQGRVLFADPLTDLSDTDGDPEPGSDLDRGAGPDAVGPESVPEVPDLPDGGGLVPDGPDESDALDPSDPIFGSPADTVLG
ncbi:hypothetical protein [Streptomyces sp. NPDC021608]|uniref:hypothetical protein n=1 Tax=Streptomyces sp. NPDC021608 TaxID=3154903 RepID=UPI0033E5EF72